MSFAALHSPAEWHARFGPQPAVISVGNFDGLHLGHQQILRRVMGRARPVQAIAGVVTFDPHPLKVLRPAEAPVLVETLAQRLAGFASVGLDAALVLHFDAVLAAVSARDFVRGILVDQLHVAAILVGENFRFGHRQEGNVTALREMADEFGFAMEIIEPVTVAGEVVSSTAVRKAVMEGRVADAARLLGRPFALTGQIRKGEGRGRSILVPTLNLAAEQELLPRTGVYVTEVEVTGRIYRAATNVGFRPTFDGKALSIESHLFDFSDMLSAGRIEVRFRERLRDERKFNGPDELLRQISTDLEQAEDFFQRNEASPAIPRSV